MPNASDIITYGTAGIGALVVSTGTGSNVLADTPTLVTPTTVLLKSLRIQ